jgi:hypothetical protein
VRGRSIDCRAKRTSQPLGSAESGSVRLSPPLIESHALLSDPIYGR